MRVSSQRMLDTVCVTCACARPATSVCQVYVCAAGDVFLSADRCVRVNADRS